MTAPWSRRHLLAAGGGLALLPLARPALAANGGPKFGEPQPFSFERLIEQARGLAAQPYTPPPSAPDWLTQLTVEQQKAIRVVPERAIQLGPTPFQLRPIHLGAFFRDRVRLHVVQGESARELLYDPAMFDLGGLQPPAPLGPDTGFAGFRIFYPLDPGGGLDELLAFAGASYFRAVGRGTRFGISARGLALETGLGKPEEFPVFTSFWIVEPGNQLDPLTICALLESKSVAGAYRFVVVPRDSTTMQVDASLFFRNDVQQVGIAPLTSMFYFAPNDRVGIDDYRERVHNSGGLSIWRGGGEVLWRPLVDPSELRVSVFQEENPRGFGLLQRDRNLLDYGDLEARYDLRPNLWVEPKGAWGKGSVRVIEIPTPDESHDNIVAFWTPGEPVKAGSELRLAYSLVWSLDPPLQTGLAPVIETAIGRGGKAGDADRPPELRRIAIDFGAPFGPSAGTPAPEVALECATGNCTQPILQPNPGTGGWRVMFDSRLAGNPVELRCLLSQGGRPVSESWLYRLDKS